MLKFVLMSSDITSTRDYLGWLAESDDPEDKEKFIAWASEIISGGLFASVHTELPGFVRAEEDVQDFHLRLPNSPGGTIQLTPSGFAYLMAIAKSQKDSTWLIPEKARSFMLEGIMGRICLLDGEFQIRVLR